MKNNAFETHFSIDFKLKMKGTDTELLEEQLFDIFGDSFISGLEAIMHIAMGAIFEKAEFKKIDNNYSEVSISFTGYYDFVDSNTEEGAKDIGLHFLKERETNISQYFKIHGDKQSFTVEKMDYHITDIVPTFDPYK